MNLPSHTELYSRKILQQLRRKDPGGLTEVQQRAFGLGQLAAAMVHRGQSEVGLSTGTFMGLVLVADARHVVTKSAFDTGNIGREAASSNSSLQSAAGSAGEPCNRQGAQTGSRAIHCQHSPSNVPAWDDLDELDLDILGCGAVVGDRYPEDTILFHEAQDSITRVAAAMRGRRLGSAPANADSPPTVNA